MALAFFKKWIHLTYLKAAWLIQNPWVKKVGQNISLDQWWRSCGSCDALGIGVCCAVLRVYTICCINKLTVIKSDRISDQYEWELRRRSFVPVFRYAILVAPLVNAATNDVYEHNGSCCYVSTCGIWFAWAPKRQWINGNYLCRWLVNWPWVSECQSHSISVAHFTNCVYTVMTRLHSITALCPLG